MENLAATITHRGKSYTLASLRDSLKLTEVEDKVISARLTGLSFCELSEKGLESALDEIIIAGAVITGCRLPNTDFFAKKINSHMAEFILEYGFKELTAAEIHAAMKLNSKTSLKYPAGIEIDPVFFTGNTFNIDFLSKALANYMALRKMIDRKFQNLIDGI